MSRAVLQCLSFFERVCLEWSWAPWTRLMLTVVVVLGAIVVTIVLIDGAVLYLVLGGAATGLGRHLRTRLRRGG